MNKKSFTTDQMAELENCFRTFLSIVDNPNRPGLVETPKRVAKYWAELLEGQLYTNKEIAEMYDKCFDLEDEDVMVDASSYEGHNNMHRDLVVESGIKVFSHCEHHLALMYDMDITIAYIPKNKVIGLSKMGRIAEMCAKRLQLQEKLGADINEVMRLILGTNDVAVIINGKHGCMTARGVKSREAYTQTACLRGLFQTDTELRSELYSLIK